MSSLKKLIKNPLNIIPYGKHYSTPKFWSVIQRIGKYFVFAKKALILYYCMRDPETPKIIKALILGCLGYLILPADLLPDSIVGIGWLDDLAVLTAVSRLSESYIKPIHIEEATKKLPFVK